MQFCGFKNLEKNRDGLAFYALLSEYQCYRFSIEFMEKCFEYAFLRLELAKIFVLIIPQYNKSWKVAERIGKKLIGHNKYKNCESDPMLFIIEKEKFESKIDY